MSCYHHSTPSSLSSIIGNAQNVSLFQSFVKTGRIPNLIVYGPHGVGKNTSIDCFLREYYDGYPDALKSCVMRIDGSITRNKVSITSSGAKNDTNMDVVFFSRVFNKYPKIKIVVIHNFDNMTNDAQVSLRGVIEEYHRTTRFIIVCNDIDKVIEAIQSRCIKMSYETPNDTEIGKFIKYIQDTRPGRTKLPKDVVKVIKLISDYDLKQILHYVWLAEAYDGISADSFQRLFHIPSVKVSTDIITACISGDLEQAISNVTILIRAGHTPNDILTSLIRVLMSRGSICASNIKVTFFKILSQYICLLEKECHTVHVYAMLKDMSDGAISKKFEITWDYI